MTIERGGPARTWIGEAWVDADGTINLQLYATSDGIHISMPPSRYRKTDPAYGKILDHIGPMGPGEHRLVAPWPDRAE